MISRHIFYMKLCLFLGWIAVFTCSPLKYSVDILSPSKNATVVGGAIQFSALVSLRNGVDATNKPNTSGVRILVGFNGNEAYNGVLSNYLFECVILDSVLAAGWNIIGVEVVSSEGVSLARTSKTVYMSRLTGSIVDTARSLPRTGASHPSVLAMGTGPQVLASLARIDPQALTILDTDAAACSILGSAQYARCVPVGRPMSLSRSLYFDHSFVSYAALLDIVATARRLRSHGGTNDSIDSIMETVLLMTRHTLWLWAAPEQIPQLITLLHNSLRVPPECITQFDLSQNPDVDHTTEGKEKVDPVLGFRMHSTTEELLSQQGQQMLQVNCTCLQRGTSDVTAASIRVLTNQVEVADPVQQNNELGVDGEKVSSIVSEDWRVGRVSVHIRNACLLQDGRSLVVFNNDSHHSGAAADDVWGRLWDKAASSEDFGMQYTSLLLRPVSQHGEGSVAREALLNGQATVWQEGITALPLSAQSGHIVHQIEAVLQLLARPVACTREYGVSMDEAWRSGRVDRLIFPLLSSAKANDWVRSVVSLILQYRHEHRVDSNTEINGTSPRSCPPPPVFLREHLFPEGGDVDPSAFYILKKRTDGRSLERTIPVEDMENAICFRDLVLLGRTNAHVKFFPALDSADLFRRFVYAQLGVAGADGPAIESVGVQEDAPLYCAPSTGYCPLHVMPVAQSSDAVMDTHRLAESHRRLKVTITIRTGSRFILNLPALLETMMRTGLVDTPWLRDHVLVFETLSFEQQVRLTAETDILICVHGAAVMNGIFMRPGSVVLELFNARFVEFVFVAPLREAGVRLLYTYPRNQSQDTEYCRPDIPVHCVDPAISVFDAGSIDCVAIRTCSVRVDVEAFQLAFMEAYYHVLGAKWYGDQADQAGEQVSSHSPDLSEGSRVYAATDQRVVTSQRAAYLRLAGRRDLTAALVTAERLRIIPVWSSHPVYLLELGVLHFSNGNYSAAVSLCEQSRASMAAWTAGGMDARSVLTQANVCIGVAGTHLPGSDQRDRVLEAFHAAWQAATNTDTSTTTTTTTSTSTAEHKGTTPTALPDFCSNFGVTSSSMLAAPLESLEFNLLRAYERYGLFGQGLRWFTERLRLPEVRCGGAVVVAFAAVTWTEQSRRLIDDLETRLRQTGRYANEHEASLWNEIRRVQDTSTHLISVANLCLNKVPSCVATADGDDQDGDDCLDPGLVQNVWAELYRVAMTPWIQGIGRDQAHDDGVATPAMEQISMAPGGTGDAFGRDGVALVTQYYQATHASKLQGLNTVLQRNLDNQHISEVYLLNEHQYDFSEFVRSDKIYQFITGKRLTFRDAFAFANQYLPNRTVIVANSDIFFDDTLSRLHGDCASSTAAAAVLRNRILALRKWQAHPNSATAPPSLVLRTDSQDAWAFRAPIRPEVVSAADFHLGRPKCDNRLVRILRDAGYEVSNPAFAVRAIEFPFAFEVPVYDAQQAVPGEVSDLLLSDGSELLHCQALETNGR